MRTHARTHSLWLGWARSAQSLCGAGRNRNRLRRTFVQSPIFALVGIAGCGAVLFALADRCIIAFGVRDAARSLCSAFARMPQLLALVLTSRPGPPTLQGDAIDGSSVSLARAFALALQHERHLAAAAAEGADGAARMPSTLLLGARALVRLVVRPHSSRTWPEWVEDTRPRSANGFRFSFSGAHSLAPHTSLLAWRPSRPTQSTAAGRLQLVRRDGGRAQNPRASHVAAGVVLGFRGFRPATRLPAAHGRHVHRRARGALHRTH